MDLKRTEKICVDVTPEVKAAFDKVMQDNNLTESNCMALIVYNALQNIDKLE